VPCRAGISGSDPNSEASKEPARTPTDPAHSLTINIRLSAKNRNVYAAWPAAYKRPGHVREWHGNPAMVGHLEPLKHLPAVAALLHRVFCGVDTMSEQLTASPFVARSIRALTHRNPSLENLVPVLHTQRTRPTQSQRTSEAFLDTKSDGWAADCDSGQVS
jgi:hypothetical protein